MWLYFIQISSFAVSPFLCWLTIIHLDVYYLLSRDKLFTFKCLFKSSTFTLSINSSVFKKDIAIQTFHTQVVQQSKTSLPYGEAIHKIETLFLRHSLQKIGIKPCENAFYQHLGLNVTIQELCLAGDHHGFTCTGWVSNELKNCLTFNQVKHQNSYASEKPSSCHIIPPTARLALFHY